MLLMHLLLDSKKALKSGEVNEIKNLIYASFPGTQEKSDVFVESLKSLPTPFGQVKNK